MSHIPYTICRSGTYYYNRRVPIHAVNSYGHFIRQVLSKDPLKAEVLSKRLSDVLEGAWSSTTDATPVNVFTIIEGFQPIRVALSEVACFGPLKLCQYLLTNGVAKNGTETVFG